MLEWRSPLGRALHPKQLLELAVGSVIEVSNAKGVWTTAKVVKNNTKKHSYMLKVSYTGGKKKFGKDEWLKYDCGRFGGAVDGTAATRRAAAAAGRCRCELPG